MGLLHAGTSIFRTAALAFAWPLSIVALILSCLVAANGHWKPRAVSIFTAIVSALTIVTLPLILLGKSLRLARIGGARCSRLWELILTGLWLASWVWMATQLNKFSCTNPGTTWTETIVYPGSRSLIANTGSIIPSVPSVPAIPNTNIGFSLHGHAVAPQGAAAREALEAAAAAEHGKQHLVGRALGRNGLRRYTRRCRVYKALLGFAIPIFAILALDVMAHIWRSGDRGLVRSRSATSVSSVSSVGSPRIASAAHPGAPVATAPAVETKV
ncbi:hypothetical protein J3B02_002977 [Coemansia erecta]|uniref:Transmembrane protein n=1 Tax=Coemansia asiatica TaxID=1052880 RepID=A0A9W8CKG0_9FUNG|nr:hypothetical protein LPJ64_001631 [Coemansia asiatica]KAJ2853787.1 hypothetical protein J3B02_002977 [Coemansia erecta]KAJ2888786.1 hypothetical protein FB639_000394 [Coemansia asiatica]